MRDERDPGSAGLVELGERNAKEGSRRGADRLWPRRIGATRRERDRGAERIGRAQDRPEVARIGHVPERERDGLDAARQRIPPVDAHHPRRVAHRRDLRQQLRLDVLTGSQELDRLDARVVGRLNEILALDDEQALLLALAPRVEQPVDEPELRVRRRRDHANSHCSHEPWKSAWPANSRSPPGQ